MLAPTAILFGSDVYLLSTVKINRMSKLVLDIGVFLIVYVISLGTSNHEDGDPILSAFLLDCTNSYECSNCIELIQSIPI